MEQRDSIRWFKSCPWTLGITLLLTLANLGLLIESPNVFENLLTTLQYDRGEILAGQWWRLVTGNAVHWSAEHFFLDIGVFLFIGFLYENSLGKSYPWMLMFSGLVVTISMLVGLPEMLIYRGFSGIGSGQVAAVLFLEYQSRSQKLHERLLVFFATGVFVLKLGYEWFTGRLFFGTESIGDLGEPVPLAHVAGAVGAVAFFAVLIVIQSRRNA